MPIFKFTAMDSKGEEKKGIMEAEDERAVGAVLKEEGMFSTSIEKVKSSEKKKKTPVQKKQLDPKNESMFSRMRKIQIGGPVIKKKDLTVMTRQLAILLKAGLPLIRALKTLETQSKDPALKKILAVTSNSVESGTTFSEALALNPKSFNKLYLNMIKAGEASGALELILDRLASFMEKAIRLTRKIKAAMAYPIMVLTMASCITGALLIFIVPKFKKIFEEMLNGKKMPWLTEMVVNASDVFMANIWYILGCLIGGYILYKFVASTRKGRWGIDWLKYNTPLFGPIISKSAIAKFSRTLGTLMGSGVPILQALAIVRDTAGNEVVAKAVQQVHDAVKEGEGMARPLDSTKIFPAMVISMIEVGEETGELPEMLITIAETYDEEVDLAVEALTAMIEPIMIMFLAVVIGTIVLAMFMPLLIIIEEFVK